jgi:DNA-binding transcriptional ArsR family regulator
VPQHKDLKRLVRARMAETSENYTQALTALLSETRLDPLPDGWFLAGSHPAEYGAGLLPRACAQDGRRVMRLRFHAAEPPGGFGTVMQSIDAARYRGRRVRFSALLRGQEIANWAGAWLRVDAETRARAFDNMEDRPLRGSAGWTEAANVLDVGEDAVSVHFGVLLAGAGAVDLARPCFEVVGGDVPVTRPARRPLAPEPQGLDFGAA